LVREGEAFGREREEREKKAKTKELKRPTPLSFFSSLFPLLKPPTTPGSTTPA
jgi:hypothetical protein